MARNGYCQPYMARSMLKAKKMPAAFWGEAGSTAVFILNCSPTKSLKGMTPFEAWHGRKLDVSFLRTFGCVGHVKTTRPGLTKLEDRSTPMVFLGYEAGSKAYRQFDLRARQVHVSRNVVFDEAKSWNWEEPNNGEEGAGGSCNFFTIEHLEYRGPEEVEGEEDPGAVASSREETGKQRSQQRLGDRQLRRPPLSQLPRGRLL